VMEFVSTLALGTQHTFRLARTALVEIARYWRYERPACLQKAAALTAGAIAHKVHRGRTANKFFTRGKIITREKKISTHTTHQHTHTILHRKPKKASSPVFSGEEGRWGKGPHRFFSVRTWWHLPFVGASPANFGPSFTEKTPAHRNNPVYRL
jgi:hypothetical protein